MKFRTYRHREVVCCRCCHFRGSDTSSTSACVNCQFQFHFVDQSRQYNCLKYPFIAPILLEAALISFGKPTKSSHLFNAISIIKAPQTKRSRIYPTNFEMQSTCGLIILALVLTHLYTFVRRIWCSACSNTLMLDSISRRFRQVQRTEVEHSYVIRDGAFFYFLGVITDA